ncbi:2-deoxy-5-keto-D-gluconate 6-phosphate aldolase domain-containing protein [Jiangella endophytica]|uniref:2-deoxy-5-keto-D-gluconate 6-phosphate aldolase domain-containing protein n=1 Tax=Jiangella endophytica TaxID=1623398 RepID=UPI000E34AAA2|nr:DUF2090 domain-containing protein [Jiangella endophytica]
MATEDPLFILAFDHRVAMERRFPKDSESTGDRYARFAAAKQVILDGAVAAVGQGLDPSSVGVLVDEQYGAHTLPLARRHGFTTCMPVERSLAPLFTLEHGDDFATHVDAYDPDLVKVLVFHNPQDDSRPDEHREQLARLAEFSRWCAPRRQRFMLELLIPATAGQLAAVGGDQRRFDREVRPGLMLEAVRQAHAAGVEPDVWKIEGFEATDDYAAVAELSRSGGRDHVVCLVLGRAAGDDDVRGWLTAAAPVAAVNGFAIGRSIFEGPLESWFAGDLSRDEAVAAIGASYLGFVSTFREARGVPVP